MSATRDRLNSIYDVHGEKLRFLVVGAVNTLFGYLIFLALLATLGNALKAFSDLPTAWLSAIGHAYYLVVQWTCWVLMVPVSTTTMKYLVFRSPGRWLTQVGRAYLVYLPAQGVSTLILWLTVRLAGLPPQIGQLVTISLVTVFTFLGHKYFTFRPMLEVAEFGDDLGDDFGGLPR